MSGIANWQAQIRIDIEDLKKRIKVAEGEINNFTNEDRKVKLDIDTKTLESAIQKLDKMLDSLGKGTGDFKQFENLSKELLSIVSEVKSLSKAFGKVDDSGAKTLLSSIQNIDKSLSELNQNILNVNKNMSNMGGNTSGAVKQVENISNAYQDAAKEAEKLADAQSKIGQKTNISSASNQKKDAFPSTETKLDEAVTSAKDLDKTLEQVDIPTDSFDKVLEKLDRTKSELVDIVKITKQSISDADGKFHDLYTLKDSRGSTEIYGVNSKTDKGQILRQNIVGYDSNVIAKAAQEEEKLTEAMAKGREQSEKARQAEQKRQELAQNNAINKALDEEYRQRQKLAQEEEKQIQKNKELALSYTESTSKKLSDAISKYSYGDSSDATAMMKQMNRGLSNFGDLSNIESNIKNFDSIMDAIITDLKHSHEESLSALNNEIKAEETMQKQKDAFNKSNLNAIDMEIKKREEEAKAFSNSLKVQMESQQQAKSQMSKFENTLSKYQTKTSGYNATIARFKDGGWTSDEYLKNVQAVKDAVKKYEDLLSNIKAKGGITSEEEVQKLKEYESEIKKTISTVTNMSASEKGYNFVSGQKELDKIHKLLNENSKMSSEAKAKIKAYYKEIESGNPSMSLDRIHGEIMKIYNAEVEAGRAGRSFFDTLKNSGFHQIAAQMAGMFGFYDVINVIKQAASTVTELNTQITELAKVSEQSSKQIYADFDSYADIAKEVRGTISDTIAATADWSKNGYSIPDAKQLAEVSQLYKNVGDGIDIDTANESLISTLKGFQLEADQAEHIVDVFNEVSNNEAISSGGIGEALQRSAASFNAASTSLEKSVSLVTATNSVLQDPEKVGNMWRTVSARLRGSETELKEMGEDTDGLVTSTSKLQALVKGITGFDIMKDKDTYKDIYDIVLGIGEKWKDLSDIDRASLLEALAGKQQSNALAAALSNIDILKKSYEEATNAEGSAREENEEYSKSIQASIDLAQAKLEQLANDTLNSNFLKGAIDAGGKLIEVLDGIVKSGNAIPTLLTAIGAGLSFKNIGKCYVSA